MQLCIEYIHAEQITLCTAFYEQFKHFSDNDNCLQLPQYLNSVQNVYQLQQSTIEVCCEIM